MTTQTTSKQKITVTKGRAVGLALALAEAGGTWPKRADESKKKDGTVQFELTKAEATELAKAIIAGHGKAQYATGQQRGTPLRVLAQLQQVFKLSAKDVGLDQKEPAKKSAGQAKSKPAPKAEPKPANTTAPAKVQ